MPFIGSTGIAGKPNKNVFQAQSWSLFLPTVSVGLNKGYYLSI